MMKYISIPIFLVSFLLGLVYVFLSKPDMKVIYINPSPENCNKNVYKDKSNSCFKYNAVEVSCDTEVSEIPIQK